VLIVLAVLHILGAIKHQFIMRDGVMSRMALPKKD
jgi:cytochrome b561